MVKLIFESAKKKKSLKINKGFKKRLVKGIQIFLKKKKTKCVSVLMNNMEIYLKKKKMKSTNMVMIDIKIFLTIKKKSYLSIQKTILKWEKVKTCWSFWLYKIFLDKFIKLLLQISAFVSLWKTFGFFFIELLKFAAWNR